MACSYKYNMIWYDIYFTIPSHKKVNRTRSAHFQWTMVMMIIERKKMMMMMMFGSMLKCFKQVQCTIIKRGWDKTRSYSRSSSISSWFVAKRINVGLIWLWCHIYSFSGCCCYCCCCCCRCQWQWQRLICVNSKLPKLGGN